MEIIDKSNEKIVEFHIGEARIRNGFLKIVQITNIENLSTLTSRIKATAEKYLQKSPTTLDIIRAKCKKIEDSLLLLKPALRRKREIAWIGSAIKWIAGTPDENDFETITGRINDLTTNNNQQTLLNQDFKNQINKLTESYNKWIENQKPEEEVKIYLIDELNQIQKNIDNIFSTIHLAKGNIINQAILNPEIIQQVTKWANLNNITSQFMTQNLDFAKIYIGHSKSSLISILKFPLLDKESFKYSLIRPVIHKNRLINTNIEKIVSNKEQIFSASKDCEPINDLFICDHNYLTNIEKNECITKILRQENASCSFFVSHQKNQIEEITEGILMANNFNGTISSSSCTQPKILIGTFVIKITNCTVEVGNFVYQNQMAPTVSITDSKFHADPALKKIDHMLSLEYLEELHINNTKYIQKLENRRIWLPSTHIFFAMIITGTFVIWFLCSKKNRGNPISAPIIVTSPPAAPAPVFFKYKQRGRAYD